MQLIKLLGIAGVDIMENDGALTWEARFSWPLLFVAFWLPVQWYLVRHGIITSHIAEGLSWLIWGFVVLETYILWRSVSNQKNYLTSNWMNIVILGGIIPALLIDAHMAGVLYALRYILIPRLVIGWWIRI